MKNILIIVSIVLLLCACNRTNRNIPAVHPALENGALNAGENLSQDKEHETASELRKNLEKMTVTEIIDLYIHENKIFDTDVGNYKLSCLFLSHNEIQWSASHTGFEYYPFLYVVDDENIRIELFYYDFPNHGIIGENISAGKDYIYITKENLIARFIGNITVVENFTEIEPFKINRFMHEDLIYKIQFDAVVYDNGLLNGIKLNEIKKDAYVEIIDMFYYNINDKYPVSVRIKSKDSSDSSAYEARKDDVLGWISVNYADFFKKEIKENVNGIWLHNAVRNVIKEYGKRAVKGKIIDGTKPIKSALPGDSNQSFVLWDNSLGTFLKDADVYIEEVSEYIDIVDSVEAAWYKIYLFDEQADDHFSGWVFGNNLQISPVIDFSFNAGYR